MPNRYRKVKKGKDQRSQQFHNSTSTPKPRNQLDQKQQWEIQLIDYMRNKNSTYPDWLQITNNAYPIWLAKRHAPSNWWTNIRILRRRSIEITGENTANGRGGLDSGALSRRRNDLVLRWGGDAGERVDGRRRPCGRTGEIFASRGRKSAALWSATMSQSRLDMRSW